MSVGIILFSHYPSIHMLVHPSITLVSASYHAKYKKNNHYLAEVSNKHCLLKALLIETSCFVWKKKKKKVQEKIRMSCAAVVISALRDKIDIQETYIVLMVHHS